MWPIVARLLFSLLVNVLEKSGIITAAEAEIWRAADGFLRFVEHLKTYSKPSDFPNCPPGENLPAGSTNTNLTVGQHIPRGPDIQ